jgi:uncharacterized membrane protein
LLKIRENIRIGFLFHALFHLLEWLFKLGTSYYYCIRQKL